MSQAPRDENHVTTALFEIDGQPGQVMPGQIDESTGRVLVDNAGGVGSTLTREAPASGVVDGSNNVFTFNNPPVFVQKDNFLTSEDAGYTIAGGGPYTVTFDPLAPPTEFVYSFYNA